MPVGLHSRSIQLSMLVAITPEEECLLREERNAEWNTALCTRGFWLLHVYMYFRVQGCGRKSSPFIFHM